MFSFKAHTEDKKKKREDDKTEQKERDELNYLY